jgi:hypothetical protein
MKFSLICTLFPSPHLLPQSPLLFSSLVAIENTENYINERKRMANVPDCNPSSFLCLLTPRSYVSLYFLSFSFFPPLLIFIAKENANENKGTISTNENGLMATLLDFNLIRILRFVDVRTLLHFLSTCRRAFALGYPSFLYLLPPLFLSSFGSSQFVILLITNHII